MSTRSLICQKIGEKYKTIYCHYNGYPQYQLKILEEYYWVDELRVIEDLKRIDKLLQTRLTAINEDGSLELGLHIDENDKGDSTQFFNKAQLLEYAQDTDAEYIYIYHDQIWHVVSVDNPLLEQEVTQ